MAVSRSELQARHQLLKDDGIVRCRSDTVNQYLAYIGGDGRFNYRWAECDDGRWRRTDSEGAVLRLIAADTVTEVDDPPAITTP